MPDLPEVVEKIVEKEVVVEKEVPVEVIKEVEKVVEKEVENDRTLTRVRLLTENARIDELTRMLGGSGDAARHHAEELLKP